MKTTSLFPRYVTTGTLCAGAILFLAAGASAQDLFVTAGSTSDADVLKFTPGGAQKVIATGMDYPLGLAFDSAGDLFVANTALNAGESGNITEITPDGVAAVFASNVDPQELTFDKAGDLFECEYRSGDIYEFVNNNGTLSSTPTIFATGFANPLSVAFDSAGDLFVGDGYGSGAGRVTEITHDGVQTTIATGLTFPTGLAFNKAGDLFVCEQSTGIVWEFTPDGVQSIFATLAETDLDGLTFDKDGNLFVAAGHSSDIVKITPNGKASIFGSVGGLQFACGVALKPEHKNLTLALSTTSRRADKSTP
jgi:SMP-30/Gluconolactonase/LRE-like region